MSNFKMDDYVPVAERVDAFKTAFPDGSLQSEIVELTAGRVTVRAMAYRTPDDPRPGIGHSSLEIPGSTSFTRGSEIENAETSAWGRAIAALGFEVKRGLASAEEVRNKQPEQRRGAKASSPNAAAPAPRTPEEEALLDELLAIPGMSKARASLLADAVGVEKGTRANAEQLRAMLARATQPGESAPSPVDPPEAGTLGPASGSTPLLEGSTAAATPAASAPLRAEPSAAPSLDDVLAVSGGEVIPPELQERIDKARAKGKKAQPEQESLAEALGAPER